MNQAIQIQSTYESKPTGGFLNWLEEKLNKEMEMIRASEIPDPKVILSNNRPGVKLPPREVMMKAINAVDSKRDEGLLLPECCKGAGISMDKYHRWRKALNLGYYEKPTPMYPKAIRSNDLPTTEQTGQVA